MAAEGSIIVVGGTSGLGQALAQHYADRGREVIISGRDRERAQAVAAEVGGNTTGIALDLAEPGHIADQLGAVTSERVDHVALVAIERDQSTVAEYNVDRAIRLVTLKLVGYTETVRVLLPRMHDDSSVVLFGGSAQARPYPGSTTVTTANGGIVGLVRTLAVELAPIRVNAIHPSPVGDNWFWRDKPQEVLDSMAARTPIGRLVQTQDVVDAAVFLLENRGVNGTQLDVNGGFLLT
jgi:NAD(P)-dependent dehydrogenase (short-subunit alcohol dehydrogenase family)